MNGLSLEARDVAAAGARPGAGAANVALGERLHGRQTELAVENFPIAPERLWDFPALITALGEVKLAAARANGLAGVLNADQARLIETACLDVVSGELNAAFPTPMLQGGAGTSTNMNVNEVIANRCAQLLGEGVGVYATIHPNDHVNASQSTNDVYPTAARITVLRAVEVLRSAVRDLSGTFHEKGEAFGGILKLGRTQLQDAVPITLGQEFRAFGVALEEEVARLGEAAALMLDVNLGGTAVGSGLNAPRAYAEAVTPLLAEITGLPLKRAQDLIEASWDMGDFVTVSGALKRLALKLSKISNDLRLLSSGPVGGLGEIRLPPRQAGSSIMPGKVNPVIPEAVTQTAYLVVGGDVTVSMAAEAGQLQLNAMEPVIVLTLLRSADSLTRAVRMLDRLCVQGVEAAPDRCARTLELSMAPATLIAPLVGYDRASDLARRATATGAPVARLIVEEGLFSPEALDDLMKADAAYGAPVEISALPAPAPA